MSHIILAYIIILEHPVADVIDYGMVDGSGRVQENQKCLMASPLLESSGARLILLGYSTGLSNV